MKKLIIVIPCYNEEGALPHVIEALGKIRSQISKDYQLDVMFVNDGSSDNTQGILEQESKKHDFIYYREFSKNAGHQSALRAGINAAVDYDAAIMMDSDMQHPPELIPDMVAAWEGGAKIVQMTRQDSAQETGTIRYWVGRVYYGFINAITDLKLDYGASDYRLIDKSVTQTVAKSKENNLFLRGYFSWLPVSRVTISYKPNKRIAGASKYTLKKLLDLAYKSVLQFSEKPLRIAVSIGVLLALLSFLYGILLIILHLTGWSTVSGWASLMVVVTFCFGINFIMLGIIGSYLAHSINIQKTASRICNRFRKGTRAAIDSVPN